MEVILKHARKDPWSQVYKYPNCASTIGQCWTRTGRRYTGLSEKDARRLEEAMGYPVNHLAPESDFWATFAIRIPVEGLILHTENPSHELQYLYAKGYKRVAVGERNVLPTHDFVLTNAEMEAEQANTTNRAKRTAITHYNKMSVDQMRKCLRLYGEKSENLSPELVEDRMFSKIEEDPNKFMKLWVDNNHKETQYLIEAAIAKNVIRKQKNVYYYGTEVIGRSLQDTIATLDDKANQDIRIAIMQETEVK